MNCFGTLARERIIFALAATKKDDFKTLGYDQGIMYENGNDDSSVLLL